MDPKECLRIADQSISDLAFDNARIHLSEYWQWRHKGGFEPNEVAGTTKRGDDFARECKRRLDSAIGAKPNTFTMHMDYSTPIVEMDGFTSLESARLWLIGVLIGKSLSSDDIDQIWCEDTLGNTWNLTVLHGSYTLVPADVIEELFPINELPPRL